MSTIKSSTEHLTLNADGAGKEIKFQANGVDVAGINATGFTGDGSALSGIDTGANAALSNLSGVTGTSGQIMTSDGAGNATMQDAAGGGAWELISSTDITSAVSSVDFTTGLGTDHEQAFVVVYSNLVPSLSASEFGIQGLEGTTPVTLYNNFVSLTTRTNTSAATAVGGTNDVMMKLSAGGTDSYAGNEGTSGTFFIRGFGGYSLRLNGTYMNRHSSQSYWEGGTNIGATAGGPDNDVFTGIRCLFYANGSTTNLVQGRISLYKITHA